MPEFTIKCVNSDLVEATVFYNTDGGVLLDERHNPFCISALCVGDTNEDGVKPCGSIKEGRLPKLCDGETSYRTVRINLGHACNYGCSYCVQAVNSKGSLGPTFFSKDFINSLPLGGIGGRRIEFWGGEPLLYWDILYPLMRELREKYPSAVFYVPTNGALVTHEITNSLVELGACVSVSHDGPGQWQRGGNPLDPPQKYEIQYLFNQLAPRGCFSFNPMVTSKNKSRKEINDWFLEEIGHTNFNLGEGALIHPSCEEHAQFSLRTLNDVQEFALLSLVEIRSNAAPNFMILKMRRDRLHYALSHGLSFRGLGTSCGVDLDCVLNVDLMGNVILCGNFSPDYVWPTGKKNKIGNIYNLDEVISKKFYTHSVDCEHCPVIHICRGGCPATAGSMKQLACNNTFADSIPHFAAVVEEITGFIPYYIEGPLFSDRSDLFGLAKSRDFSKLFRKV